MSVTCLTVSAIVCTPATSAPADKRDSVDDDVTRDRKPRDLRGLGDEHLVERRWKKYDPYVVYYDEKRSIRPM